MDMWHDGFGLTGPHRENADIVGTFGNKKFLGKKNKYDNRITEKS
jgi:hypothetical protein